MVVTGVGLVSPLGQSYTAFCDALLAGEVAIRAAEFTAASGTTRRMVAPLESVPRAEYLSELDSRLYSDLGMVAAYCAETALRQAGVDLAGVDLDRCGVVFGSGFMNLHDLESVYAKFFAGQERRLSPLVIPINMANSPASRIGMQYGFRGVARTVSTACSSSSSAIADAWYQVRAGRSDLVIAGGADLVCCASLVRSWERLRILCPEVDANALACRPFDRDRNGLALGDGGALFVIENRAHAIDRGASILAELDGCFENSDAYDLLKPSQHGAVRCINGALQAASLGPNDIDLIHAHGTATSLNDATEYAALTEVFTSRLPEIHICAIKSLIGHTMGASGAMNLAAALGSINHGYVYPVPGFREPDDGASPRIISAGFACEPVSRVLINSFAFGGANVCMVVSTGNTA